MNDILDVLLILWNDFGKSIVGVIVGALLANSLNKKRELEMEKRNLQINFLKGLESKCYESNDIIEEINLEILRKDKDYKKALACLKTHSDELIKTLSYFLEYKESLFDNKIQFDNIFNLHIEIYNSISLLLNSNEEDFDKIKTGYFRLADELMSKQHETIRLLYKYIYKF